MRMTLCALAAAALFGLTAGVSAQQAIPRLARRGGNAGRGLVAVPAQGDVADGTCGAEARDVSSFIGGFRPQSVIDGGNLDHARAGGGGKQQEGQAVGAS